MSSTTSCQLVEATSTGWQSVVQKNTRRDRSRRVLISHGEKGLFTVLQTQRAQTRGDSLTHPLTRVVLTRATGPLLTQLHTQRVLHAAGNCLGVEASTADVVLLERKTCHQTVLKARHAEHHITALVSSRRNAVAVFVDLPQRASKWLIDPQDWVVIGWLRRREGWRRTASRERYHYEGDRNSPGGKAHITNQPAENPSAKSRRARRFRFSPRESDQPSCG